MHSIAKHFGQLTIKKKKGDFFSVKKSWSVVSVPVHPEGFQWG